MKPNHVNAKDSQHRFPGRRIWRCLAVVGALSLLILLNGCASTRYPTENAWEYNPVTEYPAVGCRAWHL